MQLISLDQIRPVLKDKQAVMEAVKHGFILHAEGKINLPDPVQLLFKNPLGELAGDCHVKTASSENLPYFCIKVASGFYDNPAKGLPVNNGLVMLMSADTGAPLALFQDKGHLTSIRTAAAGALAAGLTRAAVPLTLGIIGTGHQAELQARWIAQTRPVANIVIWGRSKSKALALQERLGNTGIETQTAASVAELCAHAQIIVTTTPSTTPLISAKDLKPGHHIIAMGADSPGKIELDPEVIKSADVILTDDHNQCLHHGEFGHAVRLGLVKEDDDRSFGQALSDPALLGLDDQSLSVVDLTGLGAQDLAIASLVYKSLS